MPAVQDIWKEQDDFNQLINTQSKTITNVLIRWDNLPGHDREDVRSLCLVGLYRASQVNYNRNKTSFKTVAYRYMSNECRDIWRHQNRKKRGKLDEGYVTHLSLDAMQENGTDDYQRYLDEFEAGDFLDQLQKEARIEFLATYFEKIKPKKERDIIHRFFFESETKSELCREYHMTQRNMAALIKKHQQRLQRQLIRKELI